MAGAANTALSQLKRRIPNPGERQNRHGGKAYVRNATELHLLIASALCIVEGEEKGMGHMQYRALLWFTISVSAAWGRGVQPAFSADLIKVNSPLCEVKLEGPIQPGDLKKLEEALTPRMRLCLNSPGGSYLEGLRLFEHIAALRVHTVVDAGDSCFSACAMAFMGGADGAYGDRLPDRTLHAGGRLGFHSPFLSRDGSEMNVDGDRLTAGVAVGFSVVVELIRADKYNLLPKSLVANMLETPPSSIYQIDTFKKAREAGIAITGVRRPEKITKVMLYQACVNSDPWFKDVDKVADDEHARESQLSVTSIDNSYRIVFNGFGLQNMDKCAVDVVSSPGRPAQFRVQFGYNTPQQRLMLGRKPTWYLYPPSATIYQYALE